MIKNLNTSLYEKTFDKMNAEEKKARIKYLWGRVRMYVLLKNTI